MDVKWSPPVSTKNNRRNDQMTDAHARVDAHALRYALIDIIRASLKATPEEVIFGHPCSQLIDEAVELGIDRLAEKLLSGHSTEFRLNGAGLKLYVSTWKGCSVSGDQYGSYPSTGPKLNKILKERGIHRRSDQ